MAINKVFYLAWCGYEAFHYASFLKSFLEQAEQDTFELTVICKGSKAYFSADDVRSALGIVPDANNVLVADEGRDIDVYRSMLPRLQAGERALFFNTRTIFRNRNALRWLFAVAGHPSRPLVGCCGSYERLDERDCYPNPHLRTNGFGGEATLLHSLDWEYEERPHEVECGHNSLTRQALAAGHACIVVNGDGHTFGLSEWPLSQTWRNHGQRKLLISDNRSEDFDQANKAKRRRLRSLAWFPHDELSIKRISKRKKKEIIEMIKELRKIFRRRLSIRRHFGTRHFEGFGHTPSDKIIEARIGATVKNWNRDAFIEQRRDAELEKSISFKTWVDKVGGHKWLHYFEIYDREILQNLPENPRILEIGVYNGASAQMWHELATNLKCYVGVDIDPRCAAFSDPDKNVFIHIGSQDDPVLLQEVIDKHGPFDLIIDDGSHESKHMIATFSHLFLNGLALGGIYVVEDTHTVAWKPFNRGKPTFLQFAKRLTDYLNYHYYKRKFNYFRPDGRSVSNTPAVTVWLRSVKFFDSVVIFEKKKRDDGPPQVVHK